MDSALKHIGNFLLTGDGTLSVYLNTLDELINTDTSQQDINHALETINFLLSKAKTRFLGFEVLDKILPYVNQETLEQKISYWTTLVLKACNQDDLLRHGYLLYKTLTNFAKILRQYADISKNFATNHLNKIFEIISLSPAVHHVSGLKCAIEFLKTYNKPSGQSRDILERYLKGFLDTFDDEVNYCVGKCLHLLQQTAVPGGKCIKVQEQWKLYQLHLIDSVGILLEGANEESNGFVMANGNDILGITQLKLSTEPDIRASQLFVRFHNLTIYLRTALCEPNFQSSKPIMAKKIINLISHGLIVTCAAVNHDVTYCKNDFGIFLTKVQLDLLELMKDLVRVLHSHIRIYHKSILSTLIHVIKSIPSNFKILRTEVYNVIALWCQTFHEGSRCELYADDLVPEILKDISPVKNELVSQVNAKKTSKRAYQPTPQNKKESFHMALENRNPKALLAPIVCLREIVKACSCFLKPTIFTSLQMGVLKVCTSFFLTKRNYMYNHWENRLEMYKVLETLLMAPNQHCPPPCEIILYIIQKAQLTENNAEIRRTCSNMFMKIEKIIHPHKESLLFPIESRVLRNAYNKLGSETLLEHTQNSLSNLHYGSAESDEELEPAFICNSPKNNTIRVELSEVNDEVNREISPDICSEENNEDHGLSTEFLNKSTVLKTNSTVVKTEEETINSTDDTSAKEPTAKKAKTEENNESLVNSSFSSEESMEMEGLRPPVTDYKSTKENNQNHLEKNQHDLEELESCENDDCRIAEMEACFVDELKEIF